MWRLKIAYVGPNLLSEENVKLQIFTLKQYKNLLKKLVNCEKKLQTRQLIVSALVKIWEFKCIQ